MTAQPHSADIQRQAGAGTDMSREHLKTAERLAMEVAAPLPAIMTLVAADEDAIQPAITILLQTVDDKAAELSDVLFKLRQQLEPPEST